MFLEWSDIDFKRNLIKVRGKDIFTPKTHECRDIPLNDRLKDILIEMKHESTSSFVFFPGTGDRQKDYQQRNTTDGPLYRSIYKRFKRLVSKCGFEDSSKVCIHTLRHTFGSHCIMNGVNIVALSEFMGHADIKTTMIYAHLSPEHKQNEINKLHYDIEDPQKTAEYNKPGGQRKEVCLTWIYLV